MAAKALSMPHTAGLYADQTVDGPDIGTLVVVMDRAKNLPNRKTMGKQDPYCAARLGKEAKKTGTDRRGGQTPRWDQELRFTVRDSPDYHNLKVSLFNDDKKTDLISETWVNLEDILLPGGGQSDDWHGLTYRGKYAGEIRIELTYYDTRPRVERSREHARKQSALTGSAQALDTSAATATAGPRALPSVKRRPLPNEGLFSPINPALGEESNVPELGQYAGRSLPRSSSVPDPYSNGLQDDNYGYNNDGTVDAYLDEPRVSSAPLMAPRQLPYVEAPFTEPIQPQHNYAAEIEDDQGFEAVYDEPESVQHLDQLPRSGGAVYDYRVRQPQITHAKLDDYNYHANAPRHPRIHTLSGVPPTRPTLAESPTHTHSAPLLGTHGQYQQDRLNSESQNEYANYQDHEEYSYPDSNVYDHFAHQPQPAPSYGSMTNAAVDAPPPPPSHRYSAPDVFRETRQLQSERRDTDPYETAYASYSNSSPVERAVPGHARYSVQQPVYSRVQVFPQRASNLMESSPSSLDFPDNVRNGRSGGPSSPWTPHNRASEQTPTNSWSSRSPNGVHQQRSARPMSYAGPSRAHAMPAHRASYVPAPGQPSEFTTPHTSPSLLAERGLVSVPFSPESFDAFNPVSNRSTPTDRSAEPTPMYAPQALLITSPAPQDDFSGPIVGADGRVKDPSDHLPPSSYAHERELKPARPTVAVTIKSRFGPREAPALLPAARPAPAQTSPPATCAGPRRPPAAAPDARGVEPTRAHLAHRAQFRLRSPRRLALPAVRRRAQGRPRRRWAPGLRTGRVADQRHERRRREHRPRSERAQGLRPLSEESLRRVRARRAMASAWRRGV